MPRSFLPALLLLALVTSCRTADRLWRISPLEGDASPDRVNLWPLAYHDDDGTSVLWPVFDVDDEGFAVRPIVAKDGEDWSALWPWLVWNEDTNTGWAFPYYKFEENSGLFPVANFGPLSYVGPVWWLDEEKGSDVSGGLFPLAVFGEWGYVGPAWWGSAGYGLFPLFGKGAAGGDLHHVGPVWWRRNEEGERDAGLFPLVWYADGGDEFGVLPFYSHDLTGDQETRNWLLGLVQKHDSEDEKRRWALPLYFHREKGESEDTVLFPFYWRHREDDVATVHTLLGSRRVAPDSSSLNLYPLWWSSESEEESYRMLLPLFYYEEDGDDRTLLTPLGGRGWNAAGDTRYVNVLGPIYHHSESTDGDEERTAVLWPLFERHREGDETTTRALPFYTHRETPEESESWYALGFGHGRETPKGSSSRLWPFYSSTDEPNAPDVLYDLTLYADSESDDGSYRRLFPFFSSTTNDEGAESSYLLLGHHQRTPDGSAWRVWPFASSTDGLRQPDPLYGFTLFGKSRWEPLDVKDESWRRRNDYWGGRAANEAGESVQLGLSLLYRSEETRTPSEKWDQSHVLLMWWDTQRKLTEDVVLPVGEKPGPGNVVESDSTAVLAGIGLFEEERHRVWNEGVLEDDEMQTLFAYSQRFDEHGHFHRDPEKLTEILAKLGLEADISDPALVRAALASFAEANTSEIDRTKSRVFPFYGYERTESVRDGEERVEWNGPLWIVDSKKTPESEKFSFLWYLYRSETKDETTRRDIFPFITWDSGPDETEVSFLWRFFRYERKGDRRGGHILFIPWGD